MANPSQQRDARGRWSKVGTESAADRREREKDLREVEKARRQAEVMRLTADLDTAVARLKQLQAVKDSRRDDPHELIERAQQRAAARQRVRAIRAQLKAARARK